MLPDSLIDDNSPKCFSIWPLYFDRSKSTAQGRKVPRNLSISNPNAHVLARALTLLGLQVSNVDLGRRHPRDPSIWGRVKVAVPPPAADGQRMRKADLLARVSQVYAEAEQLIKAEAVAVSAPIASKCAAVANADKKASKAVAVGPGGTILVARSSKKSKKK